MAVTGEWIAERYPKWGKRSNSFLEPMRPTGEWIAERYANWRKQSNSFLEPMPLDEGIGKEYITKEPEVIYFVDRKTGKLCAKETLLYL